MTTAALKCGEILVDETGPPTTILAEEATRVGDDDGSLVRSVLGGDRAAFGQLYDRYARLVRAICHDATGRLPVAQDLAQEAFLAAYRNLGQLRDPAKFAPWLVGIAKTTARNWRRGRSRDRHQYVGLDPGDQAADPPDPDGGRIARLRRAISSLPDKERFALHAFYLQDQSAAQAGATLGLSRSGLYRVLERAPKRLARIMRMDGEDGQ